MKISSRLKPAALALLMMLGIPLAPLDSMASDSTRDFITTCTYGALAGGLVGAATMAFAEDPSKKVGNVARGASLGLYGGIALGLYMMYGQGGGEDESAAAAAAGVTRREPRQLKMPSFALIPLISERGFEGAGAQYRITTF